MFPADAVKIVSGEPKLYKSSENERRHFCPNCGTGLQYSNAAVLPGIIDVQSATFDHPASIPTRVHIQTAERISRVEHMHELPMLERYPESI
jgi:hypothetical protein